jgi:hypothetical protein
VAVTVKVMVRRRVRVGVISREALVYRAVTVAVTVIVLKGVNMYMYMHMCAYISVCVGQYIYFCACVCVCVCVCYLLMTSSTVVFLTEDVWPSASVIGV